MTKKRLKTVLKGYSTTDLNLNFGSQAHLRYSQNPILWTHNMDRSLLQTVSLLCLRGKKTLKFSLNSTCLMQTHH